MEIAGKSLWNLEGFLQAVQTGPLEVYRFFYFSGASDDDVKLGLSEDIHTVFKAGKHDLFSVKTATFAARQLVESGLDERFGTALNRIFPLLFHMVVKQKGYSEALAEFIAPYIRTAMKEHPGALSFYRTLEKLDEQMQFRPVQADQDSKWVHGLRQWARENEFSFPRAMGFFTSEFCLGLSQAVTDLRATGDTDAIAEIRNCISAMNTQELLRYVDEPPQQPQARKQAGLAY